LINTDTWEQRKLGEVSDVRDGTHDSPKYQSIGHPFVTSKNVKNGYITYDDIQYISDEDFAEINKRSKVDINDILMGMIGTIGNMALIRTEPDFAIKNVALIKDTKQINYLYLYHLLQSPFIEKQLTSGMDGGTQKFVSLGNVRNLNVIYPSDIEQDKIGCYFEKLDHLITLHQRKLFLNFAKRNDWEQRKLGDTVQITMGQSPDGSTYSETPSDYILVQGNADLKDGWVSPRVWTSQMTKKADAGDLIMSVRAPAGAMGKTAYNAVIGRGVAAIKGNEFIYQSLVKMDSNGYWKKLSNGSTFESLNSNNIKDAEIFVPCDEEQQKIGQYFSNLDNLITLHRRAYYNKKGGLTNVHNDNQQHYAIL
jgi:type I restriction enzyme S subunit